MEAKTKLKNILIVEDEKEMLEMYALMFEGYKNEYRIDYEDNAQTALNRVKDNEYDLIILDIVMHPMPGDFFYFFVRQEKKTKETPVLVISVLESQSLSNMKEINNVNFLQKPITKDQLFKKIKGMIG